MVELDDRIALIGLGANLGDRRETLCAAADALDKAIDVRIVGRSSLYETAPVGGPAGQDRFLNAAIALETELPPLLLLDLMQSIEDAHARQREIRWGPRTLDLDLLLFGDRIIDDARLNLPHPRLAERRFVLAPMAELAPEAIHPVRGASMRALLAALDPSDEADVVRIEGDWRGAT